MAVTPLDPTTRYIRPGITKVYFVPTLASKDAPTRTELDAATDLTPEIAEVSGWTVSSDLVETPAWGTRFTSKVAGMVTADDSSITFYASQDTQDVRTVLPRDTTGFVVWMDGGDVSGATNTDLLMDVFPVTVSSVSKLRTASDPAEIEVSFAITSEPAEDVVIPAA